MSDKHFTSHGAAGGPEPTNPERNFKAASPALNRGLEDLVLKIVRMCANMPDPEEGQRQLGGLVQNAFASLFSTEMLDTDVKLEAANNKREKLNHETSKLRVQELETPEWIPTSESNHARDGAERKETLIKNWQLRHKIEGGILALVIPLMIVASVLTAQSNLMGSGLPVFLDNPLLSFTISVIPAVCSIALKSVASVFDTERAQRRFTGILYAAAGVAAVFWGLLFADQFHGLSSSLNLFEDEASWKSTAFIASQLLTEILVGAALFHRLERIVSRYSPDYYFRNLARLSLTEAREAGEKEHQQLTEQIAALEGKKREYEAACQLQVDLAVIAYWELRSRFDRA